MDAVKEKGRTLWRVVPCYALQIWALQIDARHLRGWFHDLFSSLSILGHFLCLFPVTLFLISCFQVTIFCMFLWPVFKICIFKSLFSLTFLDLIFDFLFSGHFLMPIFSDFIFDFLLQSHFLWFYFCLYYTHNDPMLTTKPISCLYELYGFTQALQWRYPCFPFLFSFLIYFNFYFGA